MYDCVVTFGDSWPAGAELKPHEHTFGALIAKHYSADYQTFAKAGSSIEAMVLQLQKFITENTKYNKVITVFFLTDYNRTVRFENDGTLSATIGATYERNYIKYLYNDFLGVFKANLAISTLQNMSRHLGFYDLYVMGWTKFPLQLHGIDVTKFYNNGDTTCLDLFKVYDNDPTHDPQYIYYDYNIYIRPNICHPNQRGHHKIASELIKWIEK